MSINNKLPNRKIGSRGKGALIEAMERASGTVGAPNIRKGSWLTLATAHRRTTVRDALRGRTLLSAGDSKHREQSP